MSENGKDENAEATPAKGRTGHLPGLAPKVIPSVHNAIEEYVDARDKRMKLTEREVEAKQHLITMMKKAGITEYRVDKHEATIKVDEQLKARLRGDEEEEEAGEPRELRAPKERKRGKAAARA